MKDFYIYTRSKDGSIGQEGDSYDSIQPAIDRANTEAEESAFHGLDVDVHVIRAIGGEFVYTAQSKDFQP